MNHTSGDNVRPGEIKWLTWSTDFFKKSEQDNKIILVNIVYDACEWCRLMDRESYSDPEIKQFISDNFIPVRINRDVQPELDLHYMTAYEAMTGKSSWPLNLFLTPYADVFYGTSFISLSKKENKPSFYEVLKTVKFLWEKDRASVIKQSRRLTQHCKKELQGTRPIGELKPNLLDHSLHLIHEHRDKENGGFYSNPKFLQTPYLNLYLYALQKGTITNEQKQHLEFSLLQLLESDTRDQETGLFFRSCIDPSWKNPLKEIVLSEQLALLSLFKKAQILFKNKVYDDAYRTLNFAIKNNFTEGCSHRSNLYYQDKELKSNIINRREDLLETSVEELLELHNSKSTFLEKKEYLATVYERFWSESLGTFRMSNFTPESLFEITNLWDQGIESPLSKLLNVMVDLYKQDVTDKKLFDKIDKVFIHLSGHLTNSSHAYASFLPVLDEWVGLTCDL